MDELIIEGGVLKKYKGSDGDPLEKVSAIHIPQSVIEYFEGNYQ